MNDIADRKFDPLVERTKDRPIAAGLVSVPEALALAAVLALCAFALAWQLNRLVVWLSLPALFLVVTYPYMKRFFVLPQAYLGVAFGFGIPMAYAANTGAVSWLAWYLLAANVFWTLAYDTEYAMVDRNDDVRLGIRTSAILFGPRDVACVMAFHAMFLAMMTAFGIYVRLGRWYFAGMALAAVLAALQYRMIRDRSREGCFRAFRANNWIGIAILAGIVVDFSARRGWPPIRVPALG
jgi:4-hydroxybenzoate polyprenyltransferase